MKRGNYSAGQLAQTIACTGCRLCVEVCPAAAAAGDGRLAAPYRLDGLWRRIAPRHRFLWGGGPAAAGPLEDYAATVYRCTLCGNCAEACPVGIDLKHLWLSIRSDLVASRAYPERIDRILKNLDESRNVFAEDNDERADWVEDADDPPDDLYVKGSGEVVFFTGCVSAYFPMAQKIPLALVDIFTAARVDFTLLGSQEWCCGFPLLGAGLAHRIPEFIDHNIEAVRATGARQVVFSCPSCFEMWRTHYPATEIEILHTSQYLARLIDQGRLKFKPLDLTVTYHDPCDLGRGARVFDAPRRVIDAIAGVRRIEMAHCRENCRCCGGGGNLEMIDAGLAGDIARAKIEEVQQTGAAAVVSACQQCLRTMATHVRRHKLPLEVLDLAQLVQRALDRA